MSIENLTSIFSIGLSFGIVLGLFPFIISILVKSMFSLLQGNTNID